MEQGSAHLLMVGYLKGGEQANVQIIFDVISKIGTAREYADFLWPCSVIITL